MTGPSDLRNLIQMADLAPEHGLVVAEADDLEDDDFEDEEDFFAAEE